MDGISFHYAQQVHFPFNPLQPGPIFFKTPRKSGLFGINCEAFGRRVNFVINEAQCRGKGANVVISYLHFYLEIYRLGETGLFLHADKCCGQNKNSTLMMYLKWHCMTGCNNNIRLSFLISGHTKFSPNGGFGLIGGRGEVPQNKSRLPERYHRRHQLLICDSGSGKWRH